MRFKVTGNHMVAGVDPGKTVELDPDDPRTLALIRAGHLEPTKKPKPVGETGPEVITGSHTIIDPKGDG
jgi:hypothetical protein